MRRAVTGGHQFPEPGRLWRGPMGIRPDSDLSESGVGFDPSHRSDRTLNSGRSHPVLKTPP